MSLAAGLQAAYAYIQRKPLLATRGQRSPCLGRMKVTDSPGRRKVRETAVGGGKFGRQLLVPFEHQFGEGARFLADAESSTALTLSTREALAEFVLEPKFVGLSHERGIEEIQRALNKGGLSDVMTRLRENEKRDFDKVMTHTLYSKETGVLATVQAVTGSPTVTVWNGYGPSGSTNFRPAAFGTRWLAVGQAVVVLDATGVTARAGGTISAVDKLAGTFDITVTSGAYGSIIVTDIVVRGKSTTAGDFEYNQAYTGLEKVLEQDTALYGVTRSTYPMLNAQVRMAGGGAIKELEALVPGDLTALTPNIIQGAWDMIGDASHGQVETEIMVADRDVQNSIWNAFYLNIRFDKKKLDVKWDEWDIGGLDFALDRMARPHSLYFDRFSDWEILLELAWGPNSMFGVPEVSLKYDGTGYPMNKVFIFSRLELGDWLNPEPQWSGVLRAITTDQTVIPGY